MALRALAGEHVFRAAIRADGLAFGQHVEIGGEGASARPLDAAARRALLREAGISDEMAAQLPEDLPLPPPPRP